MLFRSVSQSRYESDPDLRKEISTNISNVKASIEKDRLSLLASQIEYAQNDKSVSLLDETIKKTKAEKAEALGPGNDTLAASLDLKVQSLEQTRTQVTVQNTINELTVTKARKESAITYLTELNKQLTSVRISICCVPTFFTPMRVRWRFAGSP